MKKEDYESSTGKKYKPTHMMDVIGRCHNMRLLFAGVRGFRTLLEFLANNDFPRAYVLQGNTSQAKAAYQYFLNLWKDADPDIPIYKQAKAEYANLASVRQLAAADSSR